MGKPKTLKDYKTAFAKKGGKARADKYPKEKLSEWGKLGGRPRKLKVVSVDDKDTLIPITS